MATRFNFPGREKAVDVAEVCMDKLERPFKFGVALYFYQGPVGSLLLSNTPLSAGEVQQVITRFTDDDIESELS